MQMDSAHKTAGNRATYERLLMDIEHLNLGTKLSMCNHFRCLQPSLQVYHGMLILQGIWSLSTLFMWIKRLASVSISVELQLVSALKVYHVCTSIVAFVDSQT